ncbi:MAG TPA: S-adenosylmethionine:tRNA ribosyltransferase-isomerase, partial [Prolixibacteraceae bacterium]|nr:S-adenosylmethionine:tRNA ribosyltransferase-isomerase [Prolixibacteraceae bacterium]
MKDIASFPISDFNYDLPDSSVAKYPLSTRDNSKLLLWEKGEITDHVFSDLPGLLPERSMLVFNNTRVIRARLHFVKSTGANIEVFCLEPTVPHDYIHSFAQTSTCRWKCIVGNRKRWRNELLKMQVHSDNQLITLSAELLGELDGGFEICFSWDNPHFTFAEILEAAGKIPIPPYLHRDSEE